MTPFACSIPHCGTDTHRTILGDVDERGTLHPRSGVEVRLLPEQRRVLLRCPMCGRVTGWTGVVIVERAA